MRIDVYKHGDPAEFIAINKKLDRILDLLRGHLSPEDQSKLDAAVAQTQANAAKVKAAIEP